MKLTKLLAMLLALCMVLCCFAACGGDKKDDGKDEKTEETDAKKESEKETETDAPKADAELEGTWTMNIDLGEAYMAMMAMEAEEIEIELPALEFGIEWNFTKDGKFTATAVEYPADENIAAFYKEIMTFTMDAMMDMLSEDELQEYLDMEGYDSLDAYIDAMVEEEIDSAIAEMKATSEMFVGEYAVDGDVITINDETTMCEAKITFEISGNEMTFSAVEDEMEVFTMFSGAKLIKK